MTLQLAVIVSSVVGAILFFVSGYMTSRSASASQEIDALREKVTAYRVRLADADRERGQITNLMKEIDNLYEEKHALNASASQELNTLKDEITAYRNRLADAERERGRAANLGEEIQKLHAEHNTLLDKYRKLDHKWKEESHKAATLRDERSDLNQRLQQAMEQIRQLEGQTQRLKNLEVERNQVDLKLETMGRQLAALEPYKEENARLTNVVAEGSHLREIIGQLKQENRELRSLGLVTSHPLYKPSATTTRTPPAENIGDSVQHLLERFSERTGARGMALADDNGLLVAGSGKYTEGLAVICALCDGLTTQLADVLPLGSLRQLVMVDANAVSAAIHPIQVGPDRLMLASLWVGARPGSRAIAEFLNQTSGLIGGVRSQIG